MDKSENVFEENRRLRRTLRDLVALSTLPAVWIALGPDGIARSLADRIEAHMAAPLPTIGAGASIGSLMQALADADGVMVLIDGKPAGVVTRQDVLGFLAGR